MIVAETMLAYHPVVREVSVALNAWMVWVEVVGCPCFAIAG